MRCRKCCVYFKLCIPSLSVPIGRQFDINGIQECIDYLASEVMFVLVTSVFVATFFCVYYLYWVILTLLYQYAWCLRNNKLIGTLFQALVNLKVKRTLRNNISVCSKTWYFFKILNQLHLRVLKAYSLEVCVFNYFPHLWPENDCNRCRLEYMCTHTLMPALRCGAEPVGSSILLLLKSASLGRTVIQAPRRTKFRR